jgi:hypothetical protein
MKNTIILEYNQLAHTKCTKLVIIEKNDKKPRCVFCGKDLNHGEWCYMSFPQKDFACTSEQCTQDGKINEVNTGYRISRLSHKYKQFTNVFPILLEFEDQR